MSNEEKNEGTETAGEGTDTAEQKPEGEAAGESTGEQAA